MSDAAPDEGEESLARAKPKKAPNAFRTISEVADDLHIPQHVLRFWETRFPQVKPLKRGGGRRYYRPDDIVLLRRISDLLYNQGYTIKGVQRLLRESGGKLADDIPPPAPEAREPPAAATAAGEGAQLLMPGLIAAAPKPARAPKPAAARGPEAPRAEEAEIARLRGVLAATLKELEALRALLP